MYANTGILLRHHRLPEVVRRTAASLSCLVMLSAASLWHEYYVSVTTIRYNSGAQIWEVSLKVFTDDMELALSGKNEGRRFTLRNGDDNDAYVRSYLGDHFKWRDGAGNEAPVAYVGKEQEADATWIYFEIPAATAALNGVTLQHNLLMEVFDNQVNIVNVKTETQQKTYLFKKNKSRQAL